jgi:hypothetical protein
MPFGEVAAYGGQISEDAIRVVIHVEGATARREAVEGVEADDRPVCVEAFDDPGQEHGGPALEHAELGDHAAQSEPGSVAQALVQMGQGVRVSVGQ